MKKLKKTEHGLSAGDIIVSRDSEGKPYSYYNSDVWNFWSLDFDVSFTRLSGEFKLTVKSLVHKIILANSLKSKKSTILNIISGGVIFQKCIIENNGTSYDDINDDEKYRNILFIAKKQGLKFKTWKNYLMFLSHLYEFGFTKRIVENYESLSHYLSVSGESVSQAVCIPEKISSKYYGEALRIVDFYHPHRKVISTLYEEFMFLYTKWEKHYSCTATVKRHALKSMGEIPNDLNIELDYSGLWLSWLRGACYIVIAAFTGCRDGEIKSFNIHSYQEKKYAGMTIPILHGLDTKPNLGGIARSTSWVTIPSAKKAIELLWDAFGFAREKWKKQADSITHIDEKNNFLKKVDCLFITLPHMRGHRPNASRQSISHSLNNFVKLLGYRVTEDDVREFDLLNPTRKGELKVGGTLKVHPHAFRRTFAVYLVRNKLASLLDVKYQFKHMNITMTSWYANQANIASYVDMMIDTDLQNEIAGENQEHMTEVFYHIYNDAEILSGHEGKRIKSLREQGDTRFYLDRNEIRKQLQDGQLSIVEHPAGYCTNPNCDRICDMTTCKYKVVTTDKAKSLLDIREKLIKKFSDIESLGLDMPNVTSKLFYEIKSIEQVLSEHDLGYVPFDKRIFINE